MGQTARTSEQDPPKISRAVRFVRQLVETHQFDPESLARELVISPSQLDAYMSGTLEMPLDRQLCLALLLIEQVPSLRRHGYALRGQVIAATTYASHGLHTEAIRPSFRRGR